MRPRVLKDAEEEILEAMLYYEGCREGLGADFYERVSETILAIGKNPQRFPIYEGKTLSRQFRRAFVAGFPYIIIYVVADEQTFVVAVAHTSQEPGYWGHRS